MISVVIPTITGREESLARAVKGYEETLDGTSYEIIIITDSPNWPAACNRGFAQSEGEVIHFTADDLEPLPGWHVHPLLHMSVYDELPAPRVMNYREDGEFANETDGADGEETHFTRIPIMTRLQYERIGVWPEIPYAADVWVSEKARTLRIKTRMIYSYAFVHHWHQVGRLDSIENLEESNRIMEELRAEWS